MIRIMLIHQNLHQSFSQDLTSILQRNESLRAKNSNLKTKNLRKAIMKRSKLRNKYLCERTDEAKSLYKKQRKL